MRPDPAALFHEIDLIDHLIRAAKKNGAPDREAAIRLLRRHWALDEAVAEACGEAAASPERLPDAALTELLLRTRRVLSARLFPDG